MSDILIDLTPSERRRLDAVVAEMRRQYKTLNLAEQECYVMLLFDAVDRYLDMRGILVQLPIERQHVMAA